MKSITLFASTVFCWIVSFFDKVKKPKKYTRRNPLENSCYNTILQSIYLLKSKESVFVGIFSMDDAMLVQAY